MQIMDMAAVGGLIDSYPIGSPAMQQIGYLW